MLEQLPVPYGLVRFGVAPDHAKLKAVTKVFEEIARHERFRFFGNVALGREVSVAELDQRYHAIIVATGAAADRNLGIPGEHLVGVHAAADFVGWYNGRPECAKLQFDLSQEVAVVVGQGNVAIDVCRILAKSVDELRHTDIAEHALEALAASRIREIHLIGRRGPAQARFTPKELRELGTMPGWCPVIDPNSLALNPASEIELMPPGPASTARNVGILRELAARPTVGRRRIHLHFQRAPFALHGEGRLQRLSLEVQRLVGPAFEQRAEPAGHVVELQAGLLFRSVGYRGAALPGLPFDERRGILPNREGRLLAGPDQVLPGWYATGWIKRGPTGIIGTNRLDSVETVARLLDDLSTLDAPKSGRHALAALLDQSERCVVGFDEWLAIESAEQRRGAARGKVAEKFVRVADMLAAAQPRESLSAW